MGGPGAFNGPLIVDLIAWGVGGQLFAGILGFVLAETFRYFGRLEKPVDIGEIANRAAWTGATFGVLVVLVGHLLRVS